MSLREFRVRARSSFSILQFSYIHTTRAHHKIKLVQVVDERERERERFSKKISSKHFERDIHHVVVVVVLRGLYQKKIVKNVRVDEIPSKR